MIKILYDIIVGNWCKHDMEVVEQNQIIRKEDSCGWVYNVHRKFILLKCKKCGKLVTKVL